MSQTYGKSVSIPIPGARPLAVVAVAATLATGLVVGRGAFEGSGTPTAQAQEAPAAQEAPLAATPAAEAAPEEAAAAASEDGVISIAGFPAAASDDAGAVREVQPAAPAIAPAAQPIAEFAAGETVVVGADALNFRAEPGLNGEIAVVLPPGLRATVMAGPTVADGYAWYQLDANGVTGWSAGEFLDPTAPILAFAAQAPAAPLFPLGSPVVVADGDLNLRATAGLGGTIQDQLPTGTAATVVAGPTASDGFTWYQLDIDGRSGWSAGEFLAATPLGAAAPETN